MRKRISVIAGAVAAAMTVATSGAQRVDELMVSYAYDGRLLPVGRYDGTRWINTWPDPIDNNTPLPARRVEEIPNDWLGQPVPNTWTVWTRKGSSSQARVTGLVRSGTCLGPIWLTTSHDGSREESLASNRPIDIDAARIVEGGSPESDRLLRELAPLFHDAARGAVPRYRQKYREEKWGRALPRPLELAFAPGGGDGLVLRTAVTDDRSQPAILYIEAERRFDQISADDVDALVFAGWFRRNRDGVLVPITAAVETMSTGEDKTPHLRPIGIVRLAGRSAWVMTRSFYEASEVVLFDVSRGGIQELIHTSLGGC